jgi:hypothetical protein
MSVQPVKTATWEKVSRIFHVLATTGKSTALELAQSRNDYFIIDRLELAGFIQKKTVAITGQVQILLIRLSSKGIEVCHSMGWEVSESEWSRVIRLHENGNGSHAHTASILWFAYQARRRKWKVEVMPDLGDSFVAPDLLVTKKSQRVLVEVEMNPHCDWHKWRSVGRFANQQHSSMGICSLTPGRRSSLAREAKWIGVGGMATDLQTLSQRGNDSLLWLEDWSGAGI